MTKTNNDNCGYEYNGTELLQLVAFVDRELNIDVEDIIGTEALIEYEIGARFEELVTVSIDVATLGTMAPMFKRASVTVKAGHSGDVCHVVYEYKYEHSQGGSNGYTVRTHFTFR